jgi:glutamyl-tRNA reductase
LNSPSINVIGISYKNANTNVRGKFSLDKSQSKTLILEAKKFKINSIIVNSTCNRVEIYFNSSNTVKVIELLCQVSRGTIKEFHDYGYVYSGSLAVNHLFRVGTGLDSQILGDFEIIAQLNQSFKRAKDLKTIDPYFERLFNMVKHASKRIKNETNISSGATSVSFAAVRYILDNITEVKSKKILLFGTGKIGRNTCENLVKHTSNKQITLINRTENKAKIIAGKFKLIVKNISELNSEISQSDVLIVATSSNKPTVTNKNISVSKPLLILDLSVPKNVNENLVTNSNIKLLDLDYLSNVTDLNKENRKKFIPDAEKIIQEVTEDFQLWLETRKFAPTVNELKTKLKKLQSDKINTLKKKSSNVDEDNLQQVSEHLIQKITNQVANYLKESKEFDKELKSIRNIFQLDSNGQ